MVILKPLCTACERAFAANDLDDDSHHALKLPAACCLRHVKTYERIGTSHHTTAEDLKRSAESGCFICRRLLSQAHEMRHNAQIQGESTCGTLFEMIRYNRVWSEEGWLARRFTIKAFDSCKGVSVSCITKEVADQLGFRAFLRPSLRSPNGMKQAKSWLEDCLHRHEQCNRRLPSSFVPSRLVHVRQLDNGSVASAHLVTDSSLPSGTPYLSLSHCWGGAKFLTLTSTNFSRFQTAIPIVELTAVFQDALYVALQLGIPYLWIDSLCIIQDSPTDWEYESQRMADVYKGAVCNLSASGFKTGTRGFSMERSSNPSGVLPLQVDTQDGSFSASTALPEDAQYYILDSSVLHGRPWEEICNGALLGRAWVLQEQLLALRVLHFGENEMFWECKEAFANETWPSGWTNLSREWGNGPVNKALSIIGSAFRHHQQLNPLWQFMVEDLGSIEYSSGLWRRIVREYSARSLTYSKDRLPALSGIATEFSGLKEHGQYFFGHWSNDFHLGLLWSQTRPSPSPANTPAWPKIPSWSWVTLNAPVDWYIYECHSDRIDDPLVLCTSIEPMTPCNSHAITLVGYLMRFNQVEHLKPDFLYSFDNGIIELSYEGLFLHFELDQWYFDLWDSLGVQDIMKTRAMLETGFSIPLIYRDCRQITCLVLLPLPISGRGVFRRVGILHVDNIRRNLSWTSSNRELGFCRRVTHMTSLSAMVRRFQWDIPETFYQEVDGDGNYKIAIV